METNMQSKENYRGVLVICEKTGSSIHPVAYELLGKGRELAQSAGESLSCLVLSDGAEGLQHLCKRGADKVYVMTSTAFAQPEEGLFAANMSAFIKAYKPATVLIGATHLGRSIAPRIAAELKTGLTADCTELKIGTDGALEQIRPAFSDNILAYIKSKSKPQMATVRYKEFPEAAEKPEAQVHIEELPAYFTENPSIKIEKLVPLDEEKITDAQVIVAGGRGIRKEEDLALLQELAKAAGGQLAVSRALVDAGMAPSSRQVGYSGNRVKPKIYIACGISGAPQHLAGMKESDCIIAINSDPVAPIFQVADYGIVGDLYKIVPVLSEMLRKEKKCYER